MSIGKSKEVIKLASLLGQGSICDGDFVSPGSARIDGVVNGNVKVEGTLILGSTGVINGDIEAGAVQIGGEVNGNIYAPEHAELSSEAKVIGDLTTAVIVIDEHAVFQGKVNMQVEVPTTPEKEKGGFFKKVLNKDKKPEISAAELPTEDIIEENLINEAIVEDIIAEGKDLVDESDDEIDEEFMQSILNDV